MSWLITTLSRLAQGLIRVLSNFWIEQEAITNDFGDGNEQNLPLIIKFIPPNIQININVNPTWSIGDLKAKLLDGLNQQSPENSPLTSDDISVIFAGKELSDKICLDECGFGQYSVVHLINVRSKKLDHQYSQPTEKVVTTNFVSTNSEGKITRAKRNHFFVYCQLCKSIKPGKLRVRCADCKEGSLIVSRDPYEWNDVLTAGLIKGTCHTEGCDGSTAEFYFKCASDDHASLADSSSIILTNIRFNSRLVACLACTDVSDIILIFPCQDGHIICLNCFKDFCLSHLNERSFILDPLIGYTLSCPLKCPQSALKEVHIFQIMGPDNYRRYHSFAAEECLLKSGGFFCPSASCGAGIILEEEDIQLKNSNQIECYFCRSKICSKCKNLTHSGDCPPTKFYSSSNQRTNFLDQNDIDSSSRNYDKFGWDNDENLKTILRITKPCPKCGIPTEKNDGCMHMLCKCSFDWCWVCQNEWTSDCMADHWFD